MRGGSWGGLHLASDFTPLLPISVSVAESLVFVAYKVPAVFITGGMHTPQRDLSPAQFFYVNCHHAVVRRNLDCCVVAPSTAIETNLAAVSDSVVHPSSDTVVHLLLGFLGLLPDIILYISVQIRVQ